MGGCVTVSESTVVPLQRCGAFYEVATPGCHIVGCGVTSGPTVSLALRQSELQVNTRTRDNVFITLDVSVQWAVIQNAADTKELELGKGVNADTESSNSHSGEEGYQFELQHNDVSGMSKSDFFYAAAYSCRSPEWQLKSLVEEYFRIVVNRYKMDKLFDLGTGITGECTAILNKSMNEYGYCIKKVVIKDIHPSPRIRAAMNDIVASEKERTASITRAEAEKTSKIKAAEGQAEVARLQGEGIAKQRFAICEGLKESVEEFSGATGAPPSSVMSLLMMTQHTDMIRETLANAHGVTMMIQATPTSAVTLENTIGDSLKHGGLGGNIPLGIQAGKEKKKNKGKDSI